MSSIFPEPIEEEKASEPFESLDFWIPEPNGMLENIAEALKETTEQATEWNLLGPLSCSGEALDRVKVAQMRG